MISDPNWMANSAPPRYVDCRTMQDHAGPTYSECCPSHTIASNHIGSKICSFHWRMLLQSFVHPHQQILVLSCSEIFTPVHHCASGSKWHYASLGPLWSSSFPSLRIGIECVWLSKKVSWDVEILPTRCLPNICEDGLVTCAPPCNCKVRLASPTSSWRTWSGLWNVRFLLKLSFVLKCVNIFSVSTFNMLRSSSIKYDTYLIYFDIVWPC